MSTHTRNPALRDAAAHGAFAHESDLPDAPDPYFTSAGLDERPRIYRGRTTDELIPKIVSELGEDAIVVRHHRGLTGGFAGFFQRPFVEIEARRGDGRLLDRYDEDDAAPALPGNFEASQAPAEADDRFAPAAHDPTGEGTRAPRDPRPPAQAMEPPPPRRSSQLPDREEPRQTWATNPFAAALAEAEAAVRAAEPAVPPDLDAALAAALADAEAEAEAAAEAAAETEAAAAMDTAEPAVPPDHDAALAAGLAEAEAAGHPAATVPPDRDTALAHIDSLPPAEPLDPLPPVIAPSSRGRAGDAVERTPLELTLLEVGFDEQVVREVIETASAHLLPLIATGTLAERGMLAATETLAESEILAERGMRAEDECLPASVAGECLPASVEPASPSALTQAVRRALQQRIPVCSPLPPGPATIALVGPGGSGKSVCCATLLDAYRRRSTLPAARAVFLPGPSGELQVALDRSRETLASGEHPRIGQYFPEPVRIDDPGVTQALRSAREEGLLLLDTPPLSPADHASIDALAATLQQLRPDRVVLALPATLGARPASRLLEAYRPLGTSALAITHTDETDQLGVAVQVACALGLAPAYLLEGDGSGWGLTQVDPADLVDRLLAPR
jgi:flagellar biosynthesis GTPase FlhF